MNAPFQLINAPFQLTDAFFFDYFFGDGLSK